MKMALLPKARTDSIQLSTYTTAIFSQNEKKKHFKNTVKKKKPTALSTNGAGQTG